MRWRGGKVRWRRVEDEASLVLFFDGSGVVFPFVPIFVGKSKNRCKHGLHSLGSRAKKKKKKTNLEQPRPELVSTDRSCLRAGQHLQQVKRLDQHSIQLSARNTSGRRKRERRVERVELTSRGLSATLTPHLSVSRRSPLFHLC